MANFYFDIDFNNPQPILDWQASHKTRLETKVTLTTNFLNSEDTNTNRIAIDQNNQQVNFTRDYPGANPLYYYQTKERLIVTNNFKIFKDKKIKLTINPTKRLEYFARYYTNSRNTLYQEVFKILPGETWQLNYKTTPYSFQLIDQYLPTIINQERDFEAVLSSALAHNHTHHSNLAWELSGGIDSSLLISKYLKFYTTPVNSYSVIYPEHACDEAQEIKEFLKFCPHHNKPLKFKKINFETLTTLTAAINYFPDYANSLASLSYLELLQDQNIKYLSDGFGADQLFNNWTPAVKINRFKSLIHNNLKLKKITKKRSIKHLSLAAEIDYFKNFRNRTSAEVILQPNFSEYLESAALISQNYQIQRLHPYLELPMINFAKNLTKEEKLNKQFLKAQLQAETAPSLKPSKPDFTTIFSDYFQDPDYQDCFNSACNHYQDYLDLSYFNQHTDPIKAWNIIGLYLTEKNLNCF